MLRTVAFLAFFGVAAVRSDYSQPQRSPCALVFCRPGTVCRDVLNSANTLEAQCLKNPPMFDPPGVCSAGEPLLVSNGQRLGFAFCGDGPISMNCPAGYRCVVEPADRYAVCCADLSLPPPRPRPMKPGACPAPRTLTCKGSCRTDYECPNDQKCCQHACGGAQCSVPAKPTCLNFQCPSGQACQLQEVMCFAAPCPPLPTCVPITGVERPGQCPAPSGQAGLCVFDPDVNCLQDSACPAGQKCCSEGCGKVCKNIVTSTPAPVKSSCPAQPAFVDPNCQQVNLCSLQQRHSCPRGLLCCSTPCGTTCMIPQ